MSEKASILSGNAAWVAGIVVAMGVSVFALVSTGVLDGSDTTQPEQAASDTADAPVPTPAPTSPAETEEASEEAQTVETVQEPQDESTEVAAAVPEAEPQEAAVEGEAAVEEEQQTPVISPTFDVVRVDAEGNTVIAGAATPGALLGVLLDGVEIALAPADTSGKFAAILAIDPSESPRVLSLVERRDEGDVPSDATVIIAPVLAATVPVEAEEETVAVAEEQPETAPKVAPVEAVEDVVTVESAETATVQPDTVVSTEEAAKEVVVEEAQEVVEDIKESAEVAVNNEVTENTPVETAIETEASNDATETAATVTTDVPKETVTAAAPKAPAVIVSDSEGVRVVQPAAPAETTPEVLAAVSIDSISYTETGAVLVSGRGTANLFVRLYLDNAFVAESAIDDAGTWTSQLADVAGGLYELRADEVDKTGKVVSRVVTPFKRETPETIALAREQAKAAEKTEETASVEAAPAPVPQETAPEVEQSVEAPKTEAPKEEDVASVTEDSSVEATVSEVEATPKQDPEVSEAAVPETLAQAPEAPMQTEAEPAAPAAEEAISAQTDAVPVQPAAPKAKPDATPTVAPAPVRIVTVQPGSTLWAIARDRYGEGQLYLRVFEANQDKIRDPNLIYPGQVFTVPEE